jgi:hypothetical protein
VIRDTAGERGADLIVMSTHGRGGLARLVLGSVATGLIQCARVPVLLVRPAATRQQTAPEPAQAATPLVPAGSEVTLTLRSPELDPSERDRVDPLYSQQKD